MRLGTGTRAGFGSVEVLRSIRSGRSTIVATLPAVKRAVFGHFSASAPSTSVSEVLSASSSSWRRNRSLNAIFCGGQAGDVTAQVI